MFSDLKYRVRSLARRGAMEQELDSELRFHLDREIEKHIAAGVPRAEAERRARLSFGGLDRIKDDTRDARGVNVAETVAQDLRYALRGLRGRPGFAAAVVIALALGIGANAAMFGVVDRMLFRAPAYLMHPERVGQVYMTTTDHGREDTYTSFEYPRYLDFQRLMRNFDRSAVVGTRSLAVGVGESAKEQTVSAVTASFFDFFDARPVVGRFFTTAEDHTPVGAPVAVLSYDYWQSHYAGSDSVLGTAIHIDKGLYTIIGVAPRGFVGFVEGKPPIAFIPLTAYAAAKSADFGHGPDFYYATYHWGWLLMYVRAKAGVSAAAANADLTHAFAQSQLDEPAADKVAPAAVERPHAVMASVHSGRAPKTGSSTIDAKVALWVMGVAAVVLLIACANVANLLLARAITRRREVALRLSLGVSRRRLLQQFAVESLVLACLGAAAGLLVAHWAATLLNAMFAQPGVPTPPVLEPRTLLFVGLVTLAVALLTGLAPAMHAVRSDLASALKEGSLGGGSRRSRAATGLMLFQGALSVLLLVGAGLFLRSLQHVRGMRMGFDVDSLVYVEANMRGVKLAEAEYVNLDQRLLAAVQHAPGVENAAVASTIPFWTFEGQGAPYVVGKDSLARLGNFTYEAATPAYFATMGTRIVRGRGFLPSDQANSAPIAVISQTMADGIWPGENAIGKQFRVGGDTAAFKTVVGIAEDVHGQRLRGDPEFWYYVPVVQARDWNPQILVRVKGRPADAIGPLRKQLQALMPGAAYVNVTPLSDFVAPDQRSWASGATMFTAFGILALALAALGLYSVIAYAVAQRTRELGVRIALGARADEIARMVLGQGLALAVIGIGVGCALALLASRWVAPLLFDESPRDPWVFGAVAAVLVTVAAAASFIPALRAARVDPARVLRMD